MINIVGLESVSYQKNGSLHTGTRVHYTKEASNCSGLVANNVYIPNVAASTLKLGEAITFLTEPTSYGVKYIGVLYADKK